jgi:phage tail tube protein FII
MAVVMNLSYYKLTVDDNMMYEIDTLNCKHIINGVDEMAAVRDALLLDGCLCRTIKQKARPLA